MVLSLVVMLFLDLLISALPAIGEFGLRFLISVTWDPVRDIYGALPFIYGTIISSFLALLIAVPISLGAALFLTQYLPSRLSYPFFFLIEIIAAIPSVIIGLWGIFILIPLVRNSLAPALTRYLGFLPLFQGISYGPSLLSGALILAIMIIPIITSITKDAMNSVPQLQREGMMAMGSTRWEATTRVIIPYAKPGIVGGIMLGLGRAFGETMAITMVIGNRPAISASLLEPADTLASVIANQFSEATTELHSSALIELGLILFALSFIVNIIARIILSREVIRE